jgi:4,5-dihydroxyphthalate decarboxylase
VKVPGAAPEFTVLSPPENFIRTFTEQPFDVTEMSFSNYMTAFAEGRTPYVAIPVFLSRTFRHGAIFIRSDRGINAPRDLEGKTVGLVEYDMTAAVVVRGMLRDEYGVDTRSIHWRVGDPEAPWRRTIPIPWVPHGVDVQPMPNGQTLNDALVAGTIDALVGIEAPSCFAAGEPGITRLFPEWRATERDYFSRTGIFPIMHAVGIKRELHDANPWLAGALFEAFESAKAMAITQLGITNAPKATLPWVAAELRHTRNVMGDDFWPYGVAKNRKVLESLIRWSYEDELTSRRLSIDELFVPSMLDT